MKGLLTILLVFVFIAIGCDKSTTDSKDDENSLKTYSTVNVKTETDYFNFANNSGSSDAMSVHDLVFYSEKWQPDPAAPIIDDPRFRVRDSLSLSKLIDTKLEDVTEVPSMSEFVPNYISKEGDWYYMTSAHIVLPYDNVWIVNTDDGKFPAFKIISYIDEEGNMGVFNIEWKYLSE
ncbi:hypothetical protein KKF86_00895 [bacterium]|nr:hypothetical protein [bacterium]